MKVIAIDIRGSKAIFLALSFQESTVKNITEKFTSLELKDHKDSGQLKAYQKTIFDFLNGIAPDRIAVFGKNTKGQFQGSAIAFKIEGLIQSFPAVDVEVISPVSLAAFEKKNELPTIDTFVYQKDAARLGLYLIFKR